MSFFEKIKSFFSNEDDYSDGRWIALDISLWCPYMEIVKIKEALKPYAEELGWKIYTWDDTNDFDEEFGKEIFEEFKKENFGNKKNLRVTVNMRPDGRLTPEEFLKIKDKIIDLVYAMSRDLIYGGNNKKAQKDFGAIIYFNYSRTDGHRPKKSDWTVEHSVGFLKISYPLYKRLNFEHNNKEMALKIFGRALEEDVKFVFSEKETKRQKSKNNSKKLEEEKKDTDSEETNKNMKKELRDLFGFDV